MAPFPGELFHAFNHSLDKLHHADGYDNAHKLLYILGTAAWIVGLGKLYLLQKP